MGLHIISTILAFISHANRAYSTLTRQLETVITELSMAQVLWLRTNPWRMHEAKYLPLTKATCGHTGFYNGQASYLKVLVFAEAGHKIFKPLLI